MILHQKWGVITSEKEGDSIDLGMGGGEGNGIDLPNCLLQSLPNMARVQILIEYLNLGWVGPTPPAS